MAIAPGKPQTQSSTHALVIRPDTAPAKYLSRLLIYAVIALAPHDLRRSRAAPRCLFRILPRPSCSSQSPVSDKIPTECPHLAFEMWDCRHILPRGVPYRKGTASAVQQKAAPKAASALPKAGVQAQPERPIRLPSPCHSPLLRWCRRAAMIVADRSLPLVGGHDDGCGIARYAHAHHDG